MKLIFGALALATATVSVAAPPAKAPVPMFRDPVHDGAADPSIVFDPKRGEWLMFYTNRRANLPTPDAKDVSWVHGTAIGIARSKDGANWTYSGTASIPAQCTGATLWAPDVGWFDGRWHMWLTVVPGIFKDWNAPRRIVHLTSDDLATWACGETLELGSDRVIDADVVQLADGRYRLFFNDERQNKAILAADSDDLVNWKVRGKVVETKGEGPVAFRWKGSYWLISDAWKGLLVMRSDDGANWLRQDEHLLAKAGSQLTDRSLGHHPDVVVAGDRAYLYYFVQQDGEPEMAGEPTWGRRSVLQVVELLEHDGQLFVDREAPRNVTLQSAVGHHVSGRR